MLKIGVTGGIGSGKSVVCEVFKILNVPVYNADAEAKKIINSDSIIIKKFTQRFGQDIYSGGELDRKKLSAIIFNNDDELKFVNETVHPRVFAHFAEWLEVHNHVQYIIKEAALIFESLSYRELDKVILVVAPEDVRIKRVMKRDKVKAETVKKIIANQMSDEEKIKKSDFLINNDNNNLIIPQVLKLHEQFIG